MGSNMRPMRNHTENLGQDNTLITCGKHPSPSRQPRALQEQA